MFAVIDKDIQERSSTTVLRCECGGIETVYDLPLDDAAMDEAERIHVHIPTCCACGEPLDATDRAFNVLACLGCRMDSPEETEAAVQAYIEAMTVTEMGAYLARQRVQQEAIR